MSEQNTFRRAITWAYVMYWGEKCLSALMLFVLASLLGPWEFGTVAISLVYIEFIQMFLDQGLVAAIIQRKELAPQHLNSVFWLVMTLSLILGTVSVACGRWWAALNHVPELALLLSVLSVCIPLEALAIVPKAMLQREMDFKGLSLRSNVSVLLGGIVGIAMALSGFKVWALIGQIIVRDLSAVALLWKLNRWRPGFQFSVAHIKDLLSFSLPNFTAKIGVFANGQLDTFFLGVFFSPVAVGLVRLADRVVSMVLEVATRSLQVVSFPQFSRVSDKPAELKRSVLACLRMSSVVTLPALTGIALTSDLFAAALGPKWAEAAPLLRILCLVGMALVFAQFTGPLLQALSRPRDLAKLTWALAFISIAVLCVVGIQLKSAPVHSQLLGYGMARVVSGALIFVPVMTFILARLSGISFKDFVSELMPSFAAAGFVAATVIGLSSSGLLRGYKPIPALIVYAVAGIVSAAGSLLLVDRQVRGHVLPLLRPAVRGKKIESELA